MRAILAAVVLLWAGLGSGAVQAGPRERLLVSADWLASRLGDRDLVVLHVGDKAGYEAGHIPGARLVTLADVSAPPSGPEPLILEMPEPEALRARLQALGVSDRSRIVVYPSRDIQSATRVVFVLDAAGLGSRTSLLDGGLAGWTKAGRPTETAAAPVMPGRLGPLRMRPIVVDADFVKRHVAAPGYVVVDARTPDFYAGDRTGGPQGKPHKTGHIAGARSVPLTTVTTPDARLAPADEIAARFKAAGVKRGDKVIAYCHVGQQATATIFAARTLGLDVLLYDGSFEDWSRRDGAVETGPQSPVR
jgi:thiosulfate/3-mercaptopyruvate sulfurtransferase